MYAVEMRKITKRFGSFTANDQIDFLVKKGEIHCLLGENGAGKTTTIKLILGLQSITSGSVKINGYDIEKNFTKAIEKVGAIVENPDLYMYLTGYENLKLVANLYPSVKKERIDEVIKLVGLSNRIFDKVSKYSLGMRQRLGIAQAILHKPNLLVLDEPTNGLDPEGIKQIKDLIVKLAKEENMAVLISSHNLLELESFCTKVTIIKNGEIVETSTIEEAKKVNKDSIYHLVVDKTTEVLNILENKLEKLDDENIQVYAKKEEIPEIIEKLVTSGVKIYSVYPEEMSLEDAFLKKTGGNVIV